MWTLSGDSGLDIMWSCFEACRTQWEIVRVRCVLTWGKSWEFWQSVPGEKRAGATTCYKMQKSVLCLLHIKEKADAWVETTAPKKTSTINTTAVFTPGHSWTLPRLYTRELVGWCVFKDQAKWVGRLSCDTQLLWVMRGSGFQCISENNYRHKMTYRHKKTTNNVWNKNKTSMRWLQQ